MKIQKSMMFTIALAAAVSLSLAGCNRERQRAATGGADREAPEASQPYGTTTPQPGATGEAARTGSANLSAADREFVMDAAKDGMAEVEMGRLGQQKASSDTVKDFAKKLEDDHQKANDELKQLAGDLGLTLPAEVDQKHKSDLDRLSKLSGQQFDRAFMREAVQGHKKDVQAFEKEANRGQDPSVKAYASKYLPTLREHLDMARNWPSKAHTGSHADRSGANREYR